MPALRNAATRDREKKTHRASSDFRFERPFKLSTAKLLGVFGNVPAREVSSV
jgi:hypothetical protein